MLCRLSAYIGNQTLEQEKLCVKMSDQYTGIPTDASGVILDATKQDEYFGYMKESEQFYRDANRIQNEKLSKEEELKSFNMEELVSAVRNGCTEEVKKMYCEACL